MFFVLCARLLVVVVFSARILVGVLQRSLGSVLSKWEIPRDSPIVYDCFMDEQLHEPFMNNTWMRWSSAAKSMLSGNAKCSMTWRYMTSLAETKHIFIERFMAHHILHLAKTTRGSRDARTLHEQLDYKLAPQETWFVLIEHSYCIFFSW